MVRFNNIKFDIENFKSTDLFIACLGYEERSFYILDQIRDFFNEEQLMIFSIDDYKTFDGAIVERIEVYKDLIVEKYDDDLDVQKKILHRVSELVDKGKKIKIAIDYSSMPRGWYCKLPEILEQIINERWEVEFWYTEGDYVEQPEFFSTVGIESYHVFSGKPSLSIKRTRTHFIGVGYDAVRTQGLISILDPEEYVICEAYNPECMDVHENIYKVNKAVIEQTSKILSLYVNDIEFMISKLKGLVNEYYYAGESDVILVPDGPKPLIFAMSMIPWIMNKAGISCLHIVRNSNEVKKNNVKAKGGVIGFSVTKDEVMDINSI